MNNDYKASFIDLFEQVADIVDEILEVTYESERQAVLDAGRARGRMEMLMWTFRREYEDAKAADVQKETP